MTLNSDTNTSKRRRRRKFTLWLLDDSVNTVDHVCDTIRNTVPGYNSLRAEQVAIIAHHNGKAELCSMYIPDIYVVQAELMKYGLTVQLTPKISKQR